MDELGIDILFSKALVCWNNAEVPMWQPQWLETEHLDEFENELFMMHDPESTDVDRIQRIIELKYSQADLPETVNKLEQLNQEEKSQLLNLLSKFEVLFDGTLGTWNCAPIKVQLKDQNFTLVHARAYPVP